MYYLDSDNDADIPAYINQGLEQNCSLQEKYNIKTKLLEYYLMNRQYSMFTKAVKDIENQIKDLQTEEDRQYFKNALRYLKEINLIMQQ